LRNAPQEGDSLIQAKTACPTAASKKTDATKSSMLTAANAS
jgi:hypothetical protein